jgi:hypothetical protein
MEVNQEVLKSIKSLEFEQKMLFGISCSLRGLELYKLFDFMIVEEKLEPLIDGDKGFDLLKKIVNYSYELVFKKEKEDVGRIKEYIKLSYDLMPDDDIYGSVEASLAQYVASSIAYNLEFYSRQEDKYVNWCSDSSIEIVNIIGSEKFSQDNPDISNDDFLEPYFEKEIEVQLQIIDSLRDINNLSSFFELIEKNKHLPM